MLMFLSARGPVPKRTREGRAGRGRRRGERRQSARRREARRPETMIKGCKSASLVVIKPRMSNDQALQPGGNPFSRAMEPQRHVRMDAARTSRAAPRRRDLCPRAAGSTPRPSAASSALRAAPRPQTASCPAPVRVARRIRQRRP